MPTWPPELCAPPSLGLAKCPRGLLELSQTLATTDAFYALLNLIEQAVTNIAECVSGAFPPYLKWRLVI